MNRCYLGVDIGGTKSLAWLCDSAGRVLGTGLAGSGISRGGDYSMMTQVLNDITAQAVRSAGVTKDAIMTACFGISGYDWPSQRQPHLDSIAQIGLRAHIELVNDALLALRCDNLPDTDIAAVRARLLAHS